MVMDGLPKKGRAQRLAFTEPEVLTIIGRESLRNGTGRLTERQIDRTIRATRRAKKRNRGNK